MASVGTLNAKLGLDLNNFSAGLSRSLAKTQAWAASTVSTIRSASSRISGLTSMLVGGGAVYGALRAAKAAETEEQAQASLAAVLTSTGGAAGYTAQQLYDYASALQRVTNFGDEVSVGAMAVLASFKNIGGEVFAETVKLSQDVATVMGTDMKAAALQLGKALNDPAEGLSKLNRAGINFTAQQKEQIKYLVANGNLLAAQAIMINEIRSQFGGAAEAAATPLTQLTNLLGDIGESVGKKILPYLDILKTSLTDSMNSGVAGANKLNDSLSGVSSTVGMIADAAWGIGQMFMWVGGEIQRMLGIMAQTIADVFGRIPERLRGAMGLEDITQFSRVLAEDLKRSGTAQKAGAYSGGLPSERAAAAQIERAKRLANLKPGTGLGADMDGASESAEEWDKAVERLDEHLTALRIKNAGGDEWDILLTKFKGLREGTAEWADAMEKVQSIRLEDKVAADAKAAKETAEKLQDDAKKAAEHITQAARTLVEEFADEIKQVQGLIASGELSVGVGGKYLAGLMAKGQQSEGGKYGSLVSGVSVGTVEAANVLRSTRVPQEKMVNTLLESKAIHAASKELLQAIKDSLAEQPEAVTI